MPRIEHFAIYADDTTALADFYVALLGMRVVKKGTGDPPGYFLADGHGGAIELIGRPAGAAVNQRWVCHLAFWSDEMPALEARVQALGLAIEHDTRVDEDVMQTFFFNDPAGNRCQIVWRREPLGA